MKLVLGLLEKHFFSCPWNKVYEFLEAVLSIEQDERLNGAMNLVLERELAGFRLLDLRFVPITDPEEVSTLKSAVGDDRFRPVANHLRTALPLLRNREDPDYRNSVKESISAVEAMAKLSP